MAGWNRSALTFGGDWFADIEARQLQTGLLAHCDMPHCLQDASVYDPDTGQGFCFDCHERLIDRAEAIAASPGLASTLPPISEA